jgi:predicted GH43/DUF377 family glycosyl hydrolase
MSWVTEIALLMLLVGSPSLMSQTGEKSTQVVKTEIEGNYEITLNVHANAAKVFFSADDPLSKRVFLDINAERFQIVREVGGRRLVLKSYPDVGKTPWQVVVLKKGGFYRFWVNNATGWIRDPLGSWETKDPTANSEPWKAFVGVEMPPEGKLSSFKVTLQPWLQQITEPVIRRGPEGSFKEGHVLPGGIIYYKGVYYMYFTGSRHGNQEGGGTREIGVASSSDLKNWQVQPEPVVRIGGPGAWDTTGIYCSGAVVTTDDQIAVMYAAQDFPQWTGFGLAVADRPLGPFRKPATNPVYRFSSHAHEFDLLRVDHPDYRYLLFFAGFTGSPAHGKPGDRGYLIYSNDLVKWRTDPRNPVFAPETLDNWDSIHVRPRGLNKIGDTWYLWYEGNNHWNPPPRADGSKHHGWWDTVGLARSMDLVNWEYYPRNPALPALGISKKQFDHDWVGWPRMLVKDGIGYVFYVGGSEIGLRTIPINHLTNWDDEGGKVLDLLKQDSSRRERR